MLDLGENFFFAGCCCCQNTPDRALLLFIPGLVSISSNAEKPFSQNQVEGKTSQSRIDVLTTLGYKEAVADLY